MAAYPERTQLPTDLLRIHRELMDGAVLLRVAGDVDLATADHLSEHLRTAPGMVTPPAPVIVDMDEVEFLGSAGLMVLVRQNEACLRLGTPLRIVCSSRLVLRSISVAGLADVLPVTATLDQALTA